MPWARNPGYCPPEAEGKRVRVRLASGAEPPAYPGAPPGWPADGRQGCRWAILGDPSDIALYEVIQ